MSSRISPSSVIAMINQHSSNFDTRADSGGLTHFKAVITNLSLLGESVSGLKT
ncbi:hypothetical protein J6590_023186 [Homalodisca vitripennis]|nr:hypothetical protein J6590_023186 [Homalodisca vitripennis]